MHYRLTSVTQQWVWKCQLPSQILHEIRKARFCLGCYCTLGNTAELQYLLFVSLSSDHVSSVRDVSLSYILSSRYYYGSQNKYILTNTCIHNVLFSIQEEKSVTHSRVFFFSSKIDIFTKGTWKKYRKDLAIDHIIIFTNLTSLTDTYPWSAFSPKNSPFSRLRIYFSSKLPGLFIVTRTYRKKSNITTLSVMNTGYNIMALLYTHSLRSWKYLMFTIQYNDLKGLSLALQLDQRPSCLTGG